MDFLPLGDLKFYNECAPLVQGLGFVLVDLKIIPAKTITKISAVIASADPSVNIGVNDCAKVHRILLPRLEALLGTEETTMELTSPGIEHNIKNAAEFTVFTGRYVRVWDKTVTDWVSGKIVSADDKAVILETDSSDGEGNGEKSVSYENIAKAKLISTK